MIERQDYQPLQRADSPGQTRSDLALAANAMWLMVAKTAAFALNLAVPLLLVRQLTVGEFGVYKQLFLLLDTAVVLLPLGFALNACYFFPREPQKKAQATGNILLFYVLMGSLGGAFIAVFPTLPATVLNSRDLASYVPAIGIATLLWVTSSFVEFVAIANGEVRLAAVVITGTQLLRSALLVAAAGLFRSVHTLAYAAVVYGFLQGAVMMWYVCSRFSGAYRRVDWRLMRAQLAYASPLAYAGLLWWLQSSVHNYFVSHRFGAATYAIYAVGCFQLPLMGIAQQSVASVAIPRVSDLRRRGETREIVRLVAGTVRTLAALALPVYVLLLVTGHEFITGLFTQRYGASWPIFAVNLTLIPLGIIGPAEDAVFRACPEHVPFLMTTRTALLVPLLVGLWIATQRLSLVGAIAVVVGVTLAERAMIAVRVARILSMSWSDLGLFRDVAKLGIAAGVSGVVTELVRRVALAGPLGKIPLAVLMVCTGVFGVAYLGGLLLLRVLAPEERELVRRWLTRVYQVAPWSRAAGLKSSEGREPVV